MKYSKRMIVFGLVMGLNCALFSDQSGNSVIAGMSNSSTASNIKPNGTNGPTLAPTNLVSDEFLMHVEVGLLYEQMRISDTDVCYLKSGNPGSTDVELTSTYTNPFRTEVMKRMTFDFQPGLRVALGFDSSHDEWRFNTSFEWMSSKGKYVGQEVLGGILGQYIPTGTPALFYDEETAFSIDFGQVNSSLAIDYYLVDVVISRGSYVSNNYSMIPYMGINATWMYFNAVEDFFDDRNDPVTMPVGRSWLRKNFTSFWGVGPTFGVDGSFYLSNGVSIYGCGNLALLLSQTHLTTYTGFQQHQVTPGGERVRDTADLLAVYFRSVLGLQYERRLQPYDSNFKIKLGFDARYYLDPYPLVTFDAISAENNTLILTSGPGIAESGDFGMVGVILTISLDF